MATISPPSQLFSTTYSLKYKLGWSRVKSEELVICNDATKENEFTASFVQPKIEELNHTGDSETLGGTVYLYQSSSQRCIATIKDKHEMLLHGAATGRIAIAKPQGTKTLAERFQKPASQFCYDGQQFKVESGASKISVPSTDEPRLLHKKPPVMYHTLGSLTLAYENEAVKQVLIAAFLTRFYYERQERRANEAEWKTKARKKVHKRARKIGIKHVMNGQKRKVKQNVRKNVKSAVFEMKRQISSS